MESTNRPGAAENANGNDPVEGLFNLHTTYVEGLNKFAQSVSEAMLSAMGDGRSRATVECKERYLLADRPGEIFFSFLLTVKAADNRAEKVPGNNKFFILRDEALKQNPKLAECTEDSFKGALLSVLQLGLNLDSHVTLVPKKNEETGSLECVFRLGHQGFVELNRRCGQGGPA
jgi:hypothetical protein